MKRSLLVATRNAGKVIEYAEMLASLEVDWLSLNDVGISADIKETGDSFLANAVLKAQAYAEMSGLITLADDSGLEVDALQGAPGIFTARYGGSGLTPEERYELLLYNLRDVPWPDRTARFRCIIALVRGSNGQLASTEGVCEGIIAEKPTGDGGFGYDPVFFLPERGRTMAELPSAEKHRISHRGRALQALEPTLKVILASE